MSKITLLKNNVSKQKSEWKLENTQRGIKWKQTYQNLCDALKSVLKRIYVVLNTTLKKRSQINYLALCFKRWEQNKCKHTPDKFKTDVKTSTCTCMFSEALFKIAKRQKQLKCLFDTSKCAY